jgi:hypothetical protein
MTLRVFTHSVVPLGTNDTKFRPPQQETRADAEVMTMKTNAMNWLSRQIAWEARLAELRDERASDHADALPQAA